MLLCQYFAGTVKCCGETHLCEGLQARHEASAGLDSSDGVLGNLGREEDVGCLVQGGLAKIVQQPRDAGLSRADEVDA